MFSRLRPSRGEPDSGFTLIELLVVIVIIAILATLAIPAFINQRRKGWDTAVKSDLRNAATTQETVLTEQGSYTTDVADLEAAGFSFSDDRNYSGGAAALAVSADAGNSYCLEATSASGATFAFDNSAGGFFSGTC